MASSPPNKSLSILLLVCGLTHFNLITFTLADVVPGTPDVDCAKELTKWTPWTMKEELIKDGCGVRRRSRKFRTTAAERQCTDLDLVEYNEECGLISEEEICEAFQYYVLDRLFAQRNATRRRIANQPQLPSFAMSHHVDPLLPVTTCPREPALRPVDFLIMLDISGSMSTGRSKKLKKSLSRLVSRAVPSVHENSTRVAMMTFAEDASVLFNFNTCRTKRCYHEAFHSTPTTAGGRTRMAPSLNAASDLFASAAKGARKCSRKAILIITDGTHGHGEPEVPAKKLRDEQDVEIFIVALTGLIDEKELRSIASQPAKTHLYYMDTFRTLPRVFKNLKSATVPEEEHLESAK
ncbi:integrin alpha-1-like [Sycon ciliatum]|uniref:integrin alpha-1-like n=1 Tax=Sycon ciliatum TaxID=27933 RepID=UPI0031F6AA02